MLETKDIEKISELMDNKIITRIYQLETILIALQMITKLQSDINEIKGKINKIPWRKKIRVLQFNRIK